MEQDFQQLTVQHREPQRSYEVLMDFATSAPIASNLEIPEDLTIIDDVPNIDIEVEKLQSHNQQLSLAVGAEQATTSKVRASVGSVASAGAHHTPLGDVTHTHDSQGTGRSGWTVVASPTFASTAMKKQLTQLFKTATPFKSSRLGGLEAHQASSVTPPTASLTVTRVAFSTLTPPLKLQSLVTKPSISSSPSCGGGGTTTVSKKPSPKIPLASAICRASVNRSPANRAACSIAAPHSPSISAAASSPVSPGRSTPVPSPAVTAPDVRESSPAVRARQ
ncbi:hypothetical protein ABBQ32_000622 [Trebouxia sp. C0010 RCD-2024]